MNSTKVVAIVVTRNRLDKLKKCIEALYVQSVPCSILVIDNASEDGTTDWLLSQKKCQVLTLEENTGCAGGFYHGIKKALDRGAEWVWLMDDDVFPEPEALKALLECRLLVPDAGLFCSNAFLGDGTADNPPILASSQSGFSWKDRLDAGIVRIWACTFTSVLISKAAVLQSGLPIKEMFIWSDDIEYTSRLIANTPGYMVGRSRIVHMRSVRGAIENETDPERLALYYYEYRNRLYVAQKRGGEFAWRSSSRTLLSLARIWGKPFFFSKIRVILKGTLAGFFFSPPVEFWNSSQSLE
jgi:GT2 family glycosyltransferase